MTEGPDAEARLHPRCVIELGMPESPLIVVQQGSPRFIHRIRTEDMAPTDDVLTGQFAERLAQEVNLCMYHLSAERPLNWEQARGCVVGAGTAEPELLAASNRCSELKFEPHSNVLAPAIRSVVAAMPGDDADKWLQSISLALYDRASEFWRTPCAA
jgi:hypothetical protein